MGIVRPFLENDIERVARLHHRVFAIPRAFDDALMRAYEIYFRDTVLAGGENAPRLDSLVLEDSGEIRGFLAVRALPMRFKSGRIVAAIGSQFVVDPASRGLAGLQIMKAFLAGPQDLSLGDEANDNARKVWESLGGVTALPFSGQWFLPLRPATYALEAATSRGGAMQHLVRPLLRPLGGLADTVAAKLPRSPFRFPESSLAEAPVSPSCIVACAGFSRATVGPYYEVETVERWLSRAAALRQHGELTGAVLKSGSDIAGCFLYYRNHSGLSQVLHLAAQPRFANPVVEHMFCHARRRGVTALGGRLSPAFLRAYESANCVLGRNPNWMLVHSRDPEISGAFCRGDATYSPMDGEWNLHFNFLDPLAAEG